MFFVADLHLAVFLYIFALARGAFWCSSFFYPPVPNSPKEAFPSENRLSFGPDGFAKRAEWASKCAPFAMLFGPSKKMDGVDLMSRMERDGKMDSEKCRVRLFHNLSKFHAIYGILSIIGHFDRLITFNLIYHLSSLVYRFKWLSLQLK